MNASGDQVVLQSGRLRLTVVTMGGGLRELMCDDWAVLDGYGPDEVPLGAYGQPLIPWPNRLADGRYEFRGLQYQVALTEPEQHNALHGFARWMTWTVEKVNASSALLSLLLYPREGYPFALRVEVEYSLESSGVRVITSARNVGHSPLPYANGFHPYVNAGTPSIDRCVLKIPARTWLPTNERQIPICRLPVEGTAYDFRSPRPVGSARLDTAYTDLARDRDQFARVTLQAPDHSRQVAIRLDETYSHVMAFTGDTLTDRPRRRRALGVEPMTAAPNAFQTGEGLRVLNPNERCISEWGIEVL
ncbi:MAG: aldose 1-epimerase family protein [Candidatus Dormibacteraceae bacterium]